MTNPLRFMVGMAAATVLLVASDATTPAAANELYDLEHARANARAGGTLNDRDAELLERYGATTGGEGWQYRTDGFHDYTRNAPRKYRYRVKRYRD